MAHQTIRLATPGDLRVIDDIYNHFVLHSTCTYQEEPGTIDQRRAWFEAHDARHPVTVIEFDGQIAGWASLSQFHARSAYRSTVENSVYVRHDMHRRGIGSVLLADLIRRATDLGHHTIIAGIDAQQGPSIAIHRKFGFVDVARLREVGFKFGRWLDVIYMQKML